jgi:type IV secretory pathway protease TraF
MGLDLKILLGALFAICGIAAFGALAGLRINTTPSHPIGVYRIVDKEPAIGLYAVFCAPATLAELPKLDPNAPPICTEDQKGRKLLKRIVAFDRVAGTVTVQGDHPASVDSRHFGEIKVDDLNELLTSVWTVKPKNK